jgi:predicted DNA-binding ArsR family transcriptional regulator
VKVTDDEAADLDYTAPDSLTATATSAQVPDNTTEYKELEKPELAEMTGETVYIVACFQKASFIEEKVWITQEEIGHPLKFYVTDKWVRVYLNDVCSLLEAKAIYYESWPCRYGE